MQDAQSARHLVLQETASASAATHTSEPLGTGRGEDGYCGGKSDVQEERQRASSEVIGRTSDSVQCSTARRDGERSNQAPARPGARTSPCCEAASWVQGSRPGSPGQADRPLLEGSFQVTLVLHVGGCSPSDSSRGTMPTVEQGPGRGRDAACMQPHRDALPIRLAFPGHSCQLMGAGPCQAMSAARSGHCHCHGVSVGRHCDLLSTNGDDFSVARVACTAYSVAFDLVELVDLGPRLT